MYSESDLDAAVAAGALSQEAAAGLRAFVAQQRAAPAVDEEHFRLITSFNDIFVSIAAVLMLGALAWLAGNLAPPVGGAAVAAVSWGFAEYFTRRRRMALPSIVLLLTFVGGVFACGGFVAAAVIGEKTEPAAVIVSGALPAAVAAYLHWRRFMVPITVAVGAGTVVAWILAIFVGLVPGAARWLYPAMLVCGVALFLLAMRWDASDRARVTRRSDVAFWLHLVSAPLMIHPAFHLLGLVGVEETTVPRAMIAVALYLGLALVALAIDRRAVLVSALIYVLYAIGALFRAAGSVSESFALTALVIGSALLLLSAFWHRARRLVVEPLPATLRAKLPAI